MDQDGSDQRRDSDGDAPPSSVLGTSDLARYEGPLAILANRDAKRIDAELRGDRTAERALLVELARLYAERGTNLDEALLLAERAAVLTTDAPLLLELAGWRAGLGDPAGAAQHLESAARLDSTKAAQSSKNLVRAGVLYGRARRAKDALRVFDAAAALDPRDPIPHELIGTLSAWANDVVPKDRAATAYLIAADLRVATGEADGALEDLLRAFEVCPSSPEVAERVCAALVADGRGLAAEEMLRDHASALEDAGEPTAAREVHARRLQTALVDDDLAGALSSALDLGTLVGGSTGETPEIEARIDEVLSRVGLPELLAVRLTLRARDRGRGARAAHHEAAAKLFLSDLSSEREGMRALVEAAVADPLQASALDALRAYERRDEDHEPLVEALVRIVGVVRPPDASTQLRASLALELSQLAESRLGDPALADWALERARALDSGLSEQVAHSRVRLETDLAERDEEIQRAESALQGKSSSLRDARLLALRKLVSLYGRAPAFESRTFETLASICRADPADGLVLHSLALLYRRNEEQNPSWTELYESVLTGRIEGGVSARDELFIRSELVGLALASDARTAAIGAVLPLLEAVEANPRENEAHALGAAALMLAAKSGDGASKEQAQCFAIVGEILAEALGALFLAASSEIYRATGAVALAKRAAERSLEMDPSCTRGATALARVSAVLGGREAAIAIEKALGLVVPRAWLCDALARSLESIGEHELSFAWTQRWLALAPSDRRAMAELLRRCLVGTDPQRIASALNWVLAQPDPPEERAAVFADALTLLYGLERKTAEQVARRAMDVFGPHHAAMRDRLLSIADEWGDAGLGIAILERWVGASGEQARDVFIDLCQRRIEVSDVDGAARELLRASAKASPDVVLGLADDIEASAQPLQSDGLVALTEARGRALLRSLRSPSTSKAPRGDDEGSGAEEDARAAALRAVVESLRMLGALRWDLAEDPRGAEQALFEAAELDVTTGFEVYAHDLNELAGLDQAILAIFERLTLLQGESPEKRVALGLAAAHLAAEHGAAATAIDAARKVLGVEPGNAEAISIAESQASHVPDGDVAIDAIYSALAAHAMGVYGRRAAHYRAARKLERLGSRDRAIHHALRAFEAVPNEGTSWQILTRLVDPITGSPDVVEAFLSVAETSRPGEAANAYKRALEFAGKDHDGLVRALDVLLRALVAVPELFFAKELQDVLSQLKDFGPYPDLTRERLDRATPLVLKKLEGPDGARTAVHLAKALLPAGAVDGAFRCLRTATDADGGVEVYEALLGDVWQFAETPAPSLSFVRDVERRSADPHSVVGPPLLTLAAAFAAELGEGDAESALSLRAEQLLLDDRPPPPETEQEDPFADLDSSPPPPSRKDQQLPPPPEPRLELEVEPSEPPPAAPASAIPRTRRAASAVDFHAVKDGFDALSATLDSRASDSIPPGSASLRPARSSVIPRAPSVAPRAASVVPRAPSIAPRAASVAPRAPSIVPPPIAPEPASAEPSSLPATTRAEPPVEVTLSLEERAHALEAEGAHADAAALYAEMAADASRAGPDRVAFAMKASKHQLEAGDGRAALRAIDSLPKHLATEDLATLRIDVLRALGDDFGVVVAIDQRIAVGGLEDAEAAAMLVDASRLLVSVGDEQGALIRVRRAVKLAPTSPAAVLGAAELEYRARGMGTPRDAALMLETLHAIEVDLADEFVELHAFLLAEATDVIHGGGAGLRELSMRHASVGPLPLIALGMAERLLRARSFDAAVPLFQAALDGDLRGLRSLPRVALAGADAAIQAEALEEARAFLERAEQSAETRGQVERRRRELLAHDPDRAVAEPVLRALIEESSGLVRARLVQRLARLVAPVDFDQGIQLYEDALMLARRDRHVLEELRSELLKLIEDKGVNSRSQREQEAAARAEEEALASASDPAPPMDAPPAQPESKAPSQASPARSDAKPPPIPLAEPLAKAKAPAEPKAPPIEPARPHDPDAGMEFSLPESSSSADIDWVDPAEPEPIRLDDADDVQLDSGREVAPREPSFDLRHALPLAHTWPPRPEFESGDEGELYAKLLEGFSQAGDLLLERLDADRRRDRILVLRFLSVLAPGERRYVEMLQAEAFEDGDEAYSLALGHVLAVIDGRTTQAPPLNSQAREPELVQGLLTRGLITRETEVLKLLWDAGLFRRDSDSYRISNASRVTPASATGIGDVYRELTQVFGAPRTLHHLPADPMRSVEVALVNPAAIVVRGPAARSREVLFQLAHAHVSSSAEFVLASELQEASLTSLFKVVTAVFGPILPLSDDAPQSSEVFREEARLSAELWQRVGPATERKLRELLADGAPLSVASARQSGRLIGLRAGLFVTGDLWYTLSVVARSDGFEWPLAGPEPLLAFALSSAVAKDLVSFAVRAEFAGARWQAAGPRSMRR